MADGPRQAPARRNTAAVAAVVALAAPAEGLRRVVYYDPPGIPTVCFGHTGADVVSGKVYTLDECRQLLEGDAAEAVDAVDRCQPGLPPQVLAAFGDAAFNIGPKIACDLKNSTAARLLRAKRYEEACRQLPRWDKASVAGIMVSLPGLTKRRAMEMDVCLQGLAPPL